MCRPGQLPPATTAFWQGVMPLCISGFSTTILAYQLTRCANFEQGVQGDAVPLPGNGGPCLGGR